jgi:hypothetical protein
MHLKRGTVGEGEKGMGRRRGGGQYTANLGSEWTGIRATTKEGFQVSISSLQCGSEQLL